MGMVERGVWLVGRVCMARKVVVVLGTKGDAHMQSHIMCQHRVWVPGLQVMGL